MRTEPGTAQRFRAAPRSECQRFTPGHKPVPCCPKEEEGQHGRIDHHRRDHSRRITPEDNGGGDVDEHSTGSTVQGLYPVRRPEAGESDPFFEVMHPHGDGEKAVPLPAKEDATHPKTDPRSR